ncbi:hypothetical protein C8D88_102766 [Lentzea atacamensis]|uniref:RiboL-PSP-HEPN domain-containing protein n=1 Tax=Lentzea atacamensis TaxID=531938 RepID=A0A316I7S8_9PSEU|nr:hypothetical protein [Lentzea atacamensis]PWK89492.1 hypothetical protein C8D88_102766 [Lentzea atacamensis]
MPLTELKLTPLPSAPYGGSTITTSWKYLGATHQSVSGLFDALHVLRLKGQQAKAESRGKLSADEQDLLRAALVFTSSGLDACLTRLLRDTLPALVATDGAAEKQFKKWVSTRLDNKVSAELRQAILDGDPRARLVELYVKVISTPSLQATGDLRTVRDALGLTAAQVSDHLVDDLAPFFAARNEIAHELDLVDPTGPGTPSRRQRGMEAVRTQCDDVLAFVATIIQAAVRAVRAGRS